jgi:hypothetical protein
VYENYLKPKQIEWRNCKRKEKKKKTKEVIFSPGWLYQLGPEVSALGLGLEAPSIPVGITNRD